MKEIKAIIQPFMVSRIVEALNRIVHFPGLTMTKVEGFGREKAPTTRL
jgi:nitrogen regulatory protein PII